MSKQATIPEFVDGDPRSMSVALRVIKQQLETISGQRQDQSKGAPMVYVQSTQPVVTAGNAFKTGDLWVNTAESKLYFYNGNFWAKL